MAFVGSFCVVFQLAVVKLEKVREKGTVRYHVRGS